MLERVDARREVRVQTARQILQPDVGREGLEGDDRVPAARHAERPPAQIRPDVDKQRAGRRVALRLGKRQEEAEELSLKRAVRSNLARDAVARLVDGHVERVLGAHHDHAVLRASLCCCA